MDHVRELQGRLFAVVGVFVVFSAIAYPFFGTIVNYLLAPLGSDHKLVYLTPAGAFSFIIQACMYVGLIATLPFIIYNIYRFVMPAMKRNTLRKALGFTITSLVLALIGIGFAYYVSLPAALYFLTSFNLYHIDPMITIDSYFSFVMTYMLAGALLFQIPLIMLMINGATPMQPKKLMKFQDKIILGSFIVAAIISPTPDALNQTLLASPIIVMYQVGIILVWFRNRRRNKQAAVAVTTEVLQPVAQMSQPVTPALVQQQLVHPKPVMSDIVMPVAPMHRPVARPVSTNTRRYAVDGFAVQNRSVKRIPSSPQRPSRPIPIAPAVSRRPQVSFQPQIRRSIDGFVMSV